MSKSTILKVTLEGDEVPWCGLEIRARPCNSCSSIANMQRLSNADKNIDYISTHKEIRTKLTVTNKLRLPYSTLSWMRIARMRNRLRFSISHIKRVAIDLVCAQSSSI